MVKLTIDNIPVEVNENTTILEAARSVGINIPTLCFLKDINEIAACRICIVEIDGVDILVPSCNNYVKEGMVVRTNSPKVREARKTNVELILSQHRTNFETAVNSDALCGTRFLTIWGRNSVYLTSITSFPGSSTSSVGRLLSKIS